MLALTVGIVERYDTLKTELGFNQCDLILDEIDGVPYMFIIKTEVINGQHVPMPEYTVGVEL